MLHPIDFPPLSQDNSILDESFITAGATSVEMLEAGFTMTQQRSSTFRKTRQENLTEAAEDYTELVLDLINERGEARVTELARRLGISHVSALRTAKRLTQEGLLLSGGRAPITLTRRGRILALKARNKHQTLVAFLKLLGVSRKIAENDAEGIEHHVSQATMCAIRRWMNKVGMIILALVGTTIFSTPARGQQGCARALEIAPLVSSVRHLSFKHPLICSEISQAEFRAFKTKQFMAAVTPELLINEELTYKMLGLIPKKFPYADCIAHSNSADVLATYDAESGRIIIPAGSVITDDILAHEITHALQDQHYDLLSLQKTANAQTDSALAMAALCEGDAIRTEQIYHSTYGSDSNNKTELTQSQTARQMKTTDKCSLPDLLDRQNGFPYERGLRFVQLLIDTRGLLSLKRAFHNPPTSTHEIISPASYPFPSQIPRYARKKNGFHESLGEYTIFILLRQYLPLNDAIRLAKNWRGDQALLTMKGDLATISWDLKWNSVPAAHEFFMAFNHVIGKRFHLEISQAVSHFQTNAEESFAIEGALKADTVTYRFTARADLLRSRS